MRRRSIFVLVLGATIAAASLGAVTPTAPQIAAASTTRPNFVIILADDLDTTVTPIWDVMPKSASLLRDKGMTFTSTLVSSPDCCPARTSLLLGAYPHNTGVYSNDGDFGGWAAFHRNADEQKTIAVALHDQGYRTGLFGKYLNQYRQANAGLTPPAGWDDWEAFIDDTFYGGYGYSMDENGTLVSHGTAPADYSTDVIAQKATAFLDTAAQDTSQPFFAYVAPTAPHYPLPAPPRYATNQWSNATAPQLPNFYEPDLSDKPSWLQLSASFRDGWKPNIDPDYRNRMGSLMALDDLVANVVSTLDRNGQLANTYVVLTSDNGYELGAHHLNGKLAPYEESIRVPLVVAGPGVVHGSDGHMVLLSDLAPTILDFAGVSSTTASDMRSLRPLLSATPPSSWRRDVLIERRIATAPNANPANYYLIGALYDMPSYEAVRTLRYTFVEWYEQNELGGKHEYELYDLWTDPYEQNNLIKTAAGFQQNATVVVALLQRLRALQLCSGASCQ
jgi:arylsulfatase A-like enzyme